MTGTIPALLQTAHRHGIDDILRRTAARVPDKPAVICGDVQWTYAEFDRLCNRLAGFETVWQQAASGTKVKRTIWLPGEATDLKARCKGYYGASIMPVKCSRKCNAACPRCASGTTTTRPRSRRWRPCCSRMTSLLFGYCNDPEKTAAAGKRCLITSLSSFSLEKSSGHSSSFNIIIPAVQAT